MQPTKRGLTEYFYRWPDDENQLLEAINQNFLSQNVYFCPQLLAGKSRIKENVMRTPSAWADLDRCNPSNLLVEPSITIETSPNRFQALWLLDEVDRDDAEDISRRIAYQHAEQGADRSGWDLTQLLRVPLTYNFKYQTNPANIPVVTVLKAGRTTYRIGDFEMYPQVANYEYLDIPFPTDLPADTADDILQRWRTKINPIVWRLYSEVPTLTKEEGGWSKPLWQLEMSLFETGLSREEVFVVAQEAKCNKYARDGRSIRLLWKEVCRAGARADLHSGLASPEESELQPLLTDDERIVVMRQPDSFVERYITWARTLGDAAPQYHQAGAFVALSSLLAGAVRLPTSFGTILPNLWFMILADTTLTRKSTAMDIAMDMVMEIDPDAMLATDGSIEGLLTTLSTRPGRPSVFLRDEFSGLLEMMTKRDYYAGMPEMLTKMYDGKMQKRVLRKEVVEVREPVLILFAGGIKNRITSLLTVEHVASGFMPRFVYITAESDVARIKPLGPPTSTTIGTRNAIKSELLDMLAHYRRQELLEVDIKGTMREISQTKTWNASLTDDAWVRYNKLEADMLQAGMDARRPDIMTPTYDRLSKSILKAAVLLAASRRLGDDVVVELADILRAISYGEQWREFVNDVMDNVGKGQSERQLDMVLSYVQKKASVSRSTLMQNFHLSARDTTAILETLEQRNEIIIMKQGKGMIITATNNAA
jgi:hypothetical protein